MTPETIIIQAQQEGVQLALSAAGNITVTGSLVNVSKWRDIIREHKNEIITTLRGNINAECSHGTGLSDTPDTPQNSNAGNDDRKVRVVVRFRLHGGQGGGTLLDPEGWESGKLVLNQKYGRVSYQSISYWYIYTKA